MADQHFIVTEVFGDGTVRASNSDGEEKFFGLCVEDSPEPRIYLCSRHWDGEDKPDINWLAENSLRKEIAV